MEIDQPAPAAGLLFLFELAATLSFRCVPAAPEAVIPFSGIFKTALPLYASGQYHFMGKDTARAGAGRRALQTMRGHLPPLFTTWPHALIDADCINDFKGRLNWGDRLSGL